MKKIKKLLTKRYTISRFWRFTIVIYSIASLLTFYYGIHNGKFESFLKELVASPTPYMGSASSLSSSLNLSPNPQARLDSDPIVSCGPGQKSKQYIRDKSSNCKNYVDCGLNNDTVWTLMLKSECDKKHAEAHPKSTNKQSALSAITLPPGYDANTTPIDCTVGSVHYQLPYNTCISKINAYYDNLSASKTPLSQTSTSQSTQQDLINACRAKFAALGTLDSSEAEKCYTNPGYYVNLPTSNCFQTWDEYFKAHPGYAYVEGLGSKPPCN